ncbi:MAG: hypothetical protein WCK84_06190 [Bacteroidota bacterium]
MIVAIDGFSRPGWILIAGGGYEKNGMASWSTPAYAWAASGHKVAIIGTSSSGGYIPYFIGQSGATYAREFAISSRDCANL